MSNMHIRAVIEYQKEHKSRVMDKPIIVTYTSTGEKKLKETIESIASSKNSSKERRGALK